MKLLNKISIFTILFFTIFILSSCDDDIDDSPTVIQGQILDYYTLKPVLDYNIVITTTKSGFFGSYFSVLDTIKTDSLGCIYYSFTPKNGYKHHVKAYSTKYEGMNTRDLKPESINQLNINPKPFKYVSLRLINKTGKYKRFRVSKFPLEGDAPCRFKNDTSVIIRSVVPDSNHNLEIDLYECESCGESIVHKEKVWIQNLDTSYLKREF